MCFLLRMCFWSGCLLLPLQLLLSPGVQVNKQHLRNPELSPLACLIPAGCACWAFSRKVTAQKEPITSRLVPALAATGVGSALILLQHRTCHSGCHGGINSSLVNAIFLHNEVAYGDDILVLWHLRSQGATNYWQQLWVLVGNSWGEELKGLVILFFFDSVRCSY